MKVRPVDRIAEAVDVDLPVAKWVNASFLLRCNPDYSASFLFACLSRSLSLAYPFYPLHSSPSLKIPSSPFKPRLIPFLFPPFFPFLPFISESLLAALFFRFNLPLALHF